MTASLDFRLGLLESASGNKTAYRSKKTIYIIINIAHMGYFLWYQAYICSAQLVSALFDFYHLTYILFSSRDDLIQPRLTSTISPVYLSVVVLA